MSKFLSRTTPQIPNTVMSSGLECRAVMDKAVHPVGFLTL